MIDPRSSVINKRFATINRVIAVSSGKGGVGKSMIATTIALKLVKKGLKVGLFDLDFTSPSTHLIMGVKNIQPKEEKGIVPPFINELAYMSIVFYSGDLATPLRGVDISNALLELLSVIKWGNLDILILDMPPGLGDVVLDLIKLIQKIEFVIVTTSSQLAFQTVRKQLKLLNELKVNTIGVIENMKNSKIQGIQSETEKLGFVYLANIPFDKTLENSIGNSEKLLKTNFAKIIDNMVKKILI